MGQYDFQAAYLLYGNCPLRQPEKPQIFYNSAIMPPTEQGIRYGSNQF